jgi:Tfp pilus assembly protein PilF
MSNEKDLTLKESFDLAVQKHQNNNLQDAQILYQKVLALDSNYAHAHNNLGTIFKELGEIQKAKECFEKTIEINPNHVNAHSNLGVIFKELGEIQKAKDCFEKTIEIDPLNKKNQVAYGRILLILNDKLKGYEYIKKGQGVIKFTPSYYKII